MEMMPSNQHNHIHYNGLPVVPSVQAAHANGKVFYSELSGEVQPEQDDFEETTCQNGRLGNSNEGIQWKESNGTVQKSIALANGFSKLGRKSRMSSDGRGGYVNVGISIEQSFATSSTSDDDFEDIPLKSPGDEIVIFQQPLSPKYNKGPAECRKQLLKDGFRFDEQSDDDDLDLVMPLGKGVTWCSCDRYCVLQ